MRDALKDLRFGLRMLAKRPGTSATAVAALALGIGLTATMFSIVNGALLKGLPFDHPEQIVAISRLNQADGHRAPMTADQFLDYQSQAHSFEAVGGVSSATVSLATDTNAPEQHDAAQVTPNMLRLLRVSPAAGRDFTDADAAPGAAPVALISDALWTSRFNRDPATVGRTVRLNGVVTTIVGVAPPRFGFPQIAEVWTPLALARTPRRGDGASVDAIGRLKAGVGLDAARAEAAGLAGRLARQYQEDAGSTATVETYVHYSLGPEIFLVLSTMLAAVFGVFLVACVNVTNLQLARAAERTKEIAVRTALGAGRWRIVRQLLIEGLALAGLGAAAGLVIALSGVRVFTRAVADTKPPFWLDFRVDSAVLAFVAGITIVAALASSLVPALRVAGDSVNAVLKDEGRAVTSLRLGRFTRWLVMAEMAVSFCLLLVSGLMVKSVASLANVNFPFKVDSVLTGHVQLDPARYAGQDVMLEGIERLRDHLRTAPAFRLAALATSPPSGGEQFPLAIEGHDAPKDRPAPLARRLAVTPEFFDVLGVAILRGRGLAATDTASSTPVAVIGDDLARKYFPDGDALGRRIRVGPDTDRTWRTIVGVVPNLVAMARQGAVTETMYAPLQQAPRRGLLILAATRGDPTSAGSDLRSAVSGVDRDLAVADVSSLRELYASGTWPFRVFGGLFMTFGAAALVMAAAGLYGVLAFGVRRRQQEIGVRMALGANRWRIVRLILSQGLWQIAIGTIVGLAIGRLLAGQLAILLYRVSPWDVTVFAITTAVLAGTGLVASVIPAVRAASVDPLVALRHD